MLFPSGIMEVEKVKQEQHHLIQWGDSNVQSGKEGVGTGTGFAWLFVSPSLGSRFRLTFQYHIFTSLYQ